MKSLVNSLRRVFLIFGMLYFAVSGKTGFAQKTQINAEYFDIRTEPSQSDWRFFMRWTEQERLKLWQKHLGQGKYLKDWHWGWRLGWVRSCANSKSAVCTELLINALLDRALVVRAEAASRLGNLYASTGNSKIIAMLEQAFKNKANVRGGHPLFIQQRILYALHLVVNPDQSYRAERLAALYPETKAYWQRLTAAATND